MFETDFYIVYIFGSFKTVFVLRKNELVIRNGMCITVHKDNLPRWYA